MNIKNRILVIDDDKPFSEMIQLNLEATGDYEVRVENRSALAVSAAWQFLPDLILLDYIMPGLDGGDVSKALHEHPNLRHVPIVMLTALVSNSEMGPDGTAHKCGHLMLAKPIRLSNLLRCIEQQLASPVMA
jgi:CheY-like chemotaxis protein